jgi:Flp pilus assembly protein TadB
VRNHHRNRKSEAAQTNNRNNMYEKQPESRCESTESHPQQPVAAQEFTAKHPDHVNVAQEQ